jgi:very-short-patch-repair endonuclease
VAEIDGRGHLDPRQWWADLLRDAELVGCGLRVLRLPSFIVREEPELVARLLRQALTLGGWQEVAA